MSDANFENGAALADRILSDRSARHSREGLVSHYLSGLEKKAEPTVVPVAVETEDAVSAQLFPISHTDSERRVTAVVRNMVRKGQFDDFDKVVVQSFINESRDGMYGGVAERSQRMAQTIGKAVTDLSRNSEREVEVEPSSVIINREDISGAEAVSDLVDVKTAQEAGSLALIAIMPPRHIREITRQQAA